MRALRNIGPIAVAAFVGIATSAIAAEDVVKIGAPLELSGKYVVYGEQGRRGIEMALDAFGPTAAGKKIEIVFRDVQSNNQSTVTAVTELVEQEGVDFMIGPIASGIVAASVPPWRQGKPLWIVPGSSSTALEEEIVGEGLVFHTYPWAYNYHQSTAEGLANVLGEGKRLAIVYSDGSYGRSHLPSAKKYYSEAGFEIVSEELVREGTSDMNPVLQLVRRTKPDVLLGLVQTSDAIQLTKQIEIAQLDIPYLVGTVYPQIPDWVNAVGPAADKWIGVTTYLPCFESAGDPNYPKLFPGIKEWEALFRERYNHEPEFLDVTCYTSAMMLFLAIEKAQSTDKEKVAAALKDLGVTTMLGSSKFEPSSGGAENQAFSKTLVFQRQGDGYSVLYPEELATGEVLPRE
jgi:branched-chain amino acid transport system substrate-binding protein